MNRVDRDLHVNLNNMAAANHFAAAMLFSEDKIFGAVLDN